MQLLHLIFAIAWLWLGMAFPAYAHSEEVPFGELAHLFDRGDSFCGQVCGMTAIAAAFVWGAVHAIAPGHGKTVMGAYLVGARATPRHALLLGVTTSLTHTLGIVVLGAGTLLLLGTAREPLSLYPWLNLVSGGIAIAVGINLLVRRFNTHDADKNACDCPHHHHPHHHHDTASDRQVETSEPETANWSNLLAVGISIGLVPCPSALVVLLGAIASGQLGFGIALILSFGLGMAAMLVGLGLALVRAKQWVEKLPRVKTAWGRSLSVLSALAIALLGVGMSVQGWMQVGK